MSTSENDIGSWEDLKELDDSLSLKEWDRCGDSPSRSPCKDLKISNSSIASSTELCHLRGNSTENSVDSELERSDSEDELGFNLSELAESELKSDEDSTSSEVEMLINAELARMASDTPKQDSAQMNSLSDLSALFASSALTEQLLKTFSDDIKRVVVDDASLLSFLKMTEETNYPTILKIVTNNELATLLALKRNEATFSALINLLPSTLCIPFGLSFALCTHQETQRDYFSRLNETENNTVVAALLKTLFCKQYSIEKAQQYHFANTESEQELTRDINASLYLDVISLIEKEDKLSRTTAKTLIKAVCSLLLKGNHAPYFYQALSDDNSSLCRALIAMRKEQTFNLRLITPIEQLRKHHEKNTKVTHQTNGKEYVWYRHDPLECKSLPRGSIRHYNLSNLLNPEVKVETIQGSHAQQRAHLKKGLLS